MYNSYYNKNTNGQVSPIIKIKMNLKPADFNAGSSFSFSVLKKTVGPATILEIMELIKSAVDIIAIANIMYFRKNMLV